MAAIEKKMTGFFGVDHTDQTYQAFRKYTTVGLTVGSLAYGGYGLLRTGVKLMTLPTRAAFSIESMLGCAVNRGESFAGCRRLQFKPTQYQPARQTPELINGRLYRGHALDQMQNRGIMHSTVENAIKTGRKSPGLKPGTSTFHDSINEVTVVLNENDQVITVYYDRSYSG